MTSCKKLDFLASQTSTKMHDYVHPPCGEVGEAYMYCFWCGSCQRCHCFLYALCLLKRLMDFDQVCTFTSLGGERADLILVTLASFSVSQEVKEC